MYWTVRENLIHGKEGETYRLNPYELWYVAPTRTTFAVEDAKKVRDLDFAMTLHNASCGKGLIPAPHIITGGPPLRPRKGGAAGDAEDLLETVRTESFPKQPCRRNSYFLNLTRAQATRRAAGELRSAGTEKTVVRCHIVSSGAKVHIADMGLYEQLQGRPDDRDLAMKYWQEFTPQTVEDFDRIEIVAQSALYFPDWESFPQIPIEVSKLYAATVRPNPTQSC